MMTMTIFNNADGSVAVNYGRNKSIIVPETVWNEIKGHVSFLSWGELSALVAHATRGVGVYATHDVGNENPNADRNWGRRK